ncbi:FMN-dependent NADH-azoreductase [Paludibacterium yongneupense]|uniref:FMN-dependent NADH-azoreductase n=1 Tax=Paludibacterium yongneupense TaxID=400061 RepID=UPI0003FDD552|nr:NAD(P)H-dependent oxidoreductase [Paludibacterium yongneupense]
MKLLHIDSSILGDNSVSRQLSASVVAAVAARHPGLTIIHRDLGRDPIAHLSAEILGAAFTPEQDWNETQRRERELTDTLIDEFLDSDVVVIGAPMYNFSIPSQLKSWIDRIAAAGRTFRYTESGPVGLAGEKKVVVLSSRGGVYSTQQGQLMDFQEDYLRAVMGFVGIAAVEVVRAESVSKGDEARADAIAGAQAAIEALAL